MRVRRVASGQHANGKSRIASDEMIDPVAVERTLVRIIWGSDETPSFPSDGRRPAVENFFPGPGGYRFLLNTILPDLEAGQPVDVGHVTALGKGIENVLEEGEAAGMHTTDTVDFIVVLSGTAGLELDDGEKILLNAGDTFIQNGTRHRWFNPGAEPAIYAAVLCGGNPRRKA
jgi:mannose-6-phosphate isomerase-like protein (cupin superfamily)